MEENEGSPGRAEFLQWSACLAILFLVLVAQSAGSLLGSCLTADILDAGSSGTAVDWTARWLTIFSLALVVVAGSVLLAVLRWARRRIWATMAA